MKEVRSKVQPNHKECNVWIDLNADPHGGIKKYWSGTKWVIESNNTGDQIKAEVSKLKNTVEKLTTLIYELQSAFDQLKPYDDTKLHNRINKLVNRIEKVENKVSTL